MTTSLSNAVTPSRPYVKKIIIEGVTENGRTFRPSDWAERMSGTLSTFGRDHRIHYSPLLQPTIINGIRCVVVDPDLKEQYPEVFAYIMSWAHNNHLKVSEGEVSAETQN